MDLAIILVSMLALLIGGGLYVGPPGYRRGPAGLGTIIYALAAIVLIVIVLRVLDVFYWVTWHERRH